MERKQKHLLKTSRALLFQSHLPIKFWGDCLSTTTYLIIRFPSKVLEYKTPYEILYNSKLNYQSLKCFGCLCFASTLSVHRAKFKPRDVSCVFLGYPYRKKGFKLLSLQTKKNFVSRDVIFHENIFPFASTKYGESTESFLPKGHIVPKYHVPTLVPHVLSTEDNSISILPITKSSFPDDHHLGVFESPYTPIIPANIPSP